MKNKREKEFVYYGHDDQIVGRCAKQFQITQALIHCFSISNSKQEVLDKIVTMIQKESDCQFVGIRVLDENGYIPYQSYVGFSREFWEKENMIQISQEDCSCTRILSGKLLPFDMPVINEAGSLCCNDTVAFGKALSPDQQKMYRGACNEAGYRSVAVIPIIYNGAARGIIHLADFATNKISTATMEFIEAIAPLVGEVINRDVLEKSLKISKEKQFMLESIVKGISSLAFVIDINTHRFLYVSTAMEVLYGNDWMMRECSEVLSCSNCYFDSVKKINCNSDGFWWERYESKHDRYFLAEKKAIRWLDGSGLQVVFLTDITVQKKAEQELRNSNANLCHTLRELQEISATLEEEVMERQAVEKSLRENQDKLAKSEAQYRGLFEHLGSTLSYRRVITDQDGNPIDLEHVTVNPAFIRTYGIINTKVEGVRLTELFPGIENESFDWIRSLGEVALTGRPVIFEQYLSVVDKYLRVAAYSPETGYVACIAEDITERIKNEKALVQKTAQIRQQAYFDSLTGLPNRAHFNERLIEEIEKARRDQTSGAVFFIDLDDLKAVNDVYGHSYGDDFIIAAGNRIMKEIGQNAFVARIGGDEFFVIISNEFDHRCIAKIADRLIAVLGQECQIVGETFQMAASIGVAIYPEDGDSAEKIFKNVDMAMYAAKRAGKNQWCFYERDWEKKAYEKMILTNRLRHAIEKGELLLHYQPQLTYNPKSIVGFEALLRWNSPEYGLTSPMSFIPLAEKSGMIHQIGQWVLKEACRFARKLFDEGWRGIHVAVNVSPYQLLASNFVDNVRNILNEIGVDPYLLEIEITETVMMNFLEENMIKIRELKNMGIRLSLDDFGTGYSSLTYLQRLPVNVLKIDKSFVDAIDKGDIQLGIIPAIVEMAHSMDVTVVAEGVETEHQFNYLYNIRCDYFQGYFASRPMPMEEAIRYLSAIL